MAMSRELLADPQKAAAARRRGETLRRAELAAMQAVHGSSGSSASPTAHAFLPGGSTGDHGHDQGQGQGAAFEFASTTGSHHIGALAPESVASSRETTAEGRARQEYEARRRHGGSNPPIGRSRAMLESVARERPPRVRGDGTGAAQST